MLQQPHVYVLLRAPFRSGYVTEPCRDQHERANDPGTLVEHRIPQEFGGVKAHSTQALQWPREGCHDPDADGWAGGTVPDEVVPKAVIDATCEMARELLIADRTAAPPGEGLKYFNDATAQTGYDKRDTRPIISHVAQAMLAKFGSLIVAIRSAPSFEVKRTPPASYAPENPETPW